MRVDMEFLFACSDISRNSRLSWGVIYSTKLSGNFGPKLKGSALSNWESFEKISPPFEVDHFSRLDRYGPTLVPEAFF